jgi:hypothetical protein
MEAKTSRMVRKTRSGQLYISLPLHITKYMNIEKGELINVSIEKIKKD